MVAMAPADAAEKLWIPVEWVFDVGGINCAAITLQSQRRRIQEKYLTCFAFNSLVKDDKEPCIGRISQR
jgi:hypothetical protein